MVFKRNLIVNKNEYHITEVEINRELYVYILYSNMRTNTKVIYRQKVSILYAHIAHIDQNSSLKKVNRHFLSMAHLLKSSDR